MHDTVSHQEWGRECGIRWLEIAWSEEQREGDAHTRVRHSAAAHSTHTMTNCQLRHAAAYVLHTQFQLHQIVHTMTGAAISLIRIVNLALVIAVVLCRTSDMRARRHQSPRVTALVPRPIPM